MLAVSVSHFVSFALVRPHRFHVSLSHTKKAVGQLRDFQDYAGPEAHALPAFPDSGDLLSLSELTGYEQRAKRLVLILSGCYSESALRCRWLHYASSRRGHAQCDHPQFGPLQLIE
jgi:hypothetical protein